MSDATETVPAVEPDQTYRDNIGALVTRMKRIDDSISLLRGTDLYTDSTQVVSESVAANAIADKQLELNSEFPYWMIPAQPRWVYLYANGGLFPFASVPPFTPSTGYYPRLRSLRVLVDYEAVASIYRVELSSRPFDINYHDVQNIPPDALLGTQWANEFTQVAPVAPGALVTNGFLRRTSNPSGFVNFRVSFTVDTVAPTLNLYILDGLGRQRLTTPIYASFAATADLFVRLTVEPNPFQIAYQLTGSGTAHFTIDRDIMTR